MFSVFFPTYLFPRAVQLRVILPAVRLVCRDFVQCRFETRERVVKRLTFLKACCLDVIFINHYDKNRFILHVKRNQFRQKGLSELFFSRNNCVSERGFVVPIKSVYNKLKKLFSEVSF